MIRVRVFPPPLCRFDNLDERGWMTLEDGALLSEVVKKIGMPRTLARLAVVSVNGEKAPLKLELKDGDVVGFFMLVTGG